MHSFEVDIRICQPENSDVHRGEAEVNITFEGWLILMLTEKECTNCFVTWLCLSFPSLFKVFSYYFLKSDVPRKIISTISFPNFCNSYEISKIIAFFNPYMPSVLFVGHRQILQTQIRSHRMRRLIRVSTVCLHNYLVKIERKWKIPPNIPYNRNRLFQLITVGSSFPHKWVKCCSHKMNKFWIQHIFTCEIYIRNQSVLQYLILALYQEWQK